MAESTLTKRKSRNRTGISEIYGDRVIYDEYDKPITAFRKTVSGSRELPPRDYRPEGRFCLESVEEREPLVVLVSVTEERPTVRIDDIITLAGVQLRVVGKTNRDRTVSNGYLRCEFQMALRNSDDLRGRAIILQAAERQAVFESVIERGLGNV